MAAGPRAYLRKLQRAEKRAGVAAPFSRRRTRHGQKKARARCCEQVASRERCQGNSDRVACSSVTGPLWQTALSL
jgi:hypothetical protein